MRIFLSDSNVRLVKLVNLVEIIQVHKIGHFVTGEKIGHFAIKNLRRDYY